MLLTTTQKMTCFTFYKYLLWKRNYIYINKNKDIYFQQIGFTMQYMHL